MRFALVGERALRPRLQGLISRRADDLLELLGEGRSGWRAMIEIALERTHHDRVEPGGQLRSERFGRRDQILVLDGACDRVDRIAREQRTTDEELPHDG